MFQLREQLLYQLQPKVQSQFTDSCLWCEWQGLKAFSIYSNMTIECESFHLSFPWRSIDSLNQLPSVCISPLNHFECAALSRWQLTEESKTIWKRAFWSHIKPAYIQLWKGYYSSTAARTIYRFLFSFSFQTLKWFLLHYI